MTHFPHTTLLRKRKKKERKKEKKRKREKRASFRNPNGSPHIVDDT
jgi:hypothetical protein